MLLDIIKADEKMWGGMSSAIFKLGFYAVLFYRLSHFLVENHLELFGRFLQLCSNIITGAEISNKAIIAPGLIILHPTGVHIGPETKIGKHAILCENSSIVLNNFAGENAPIIGDNLWLGPGGRILGPVTIGDNVWIGPNAVVLKDIPSDMIVLAPLSRIMPKKIRKKYES